ncbi:hypothetical protein [Lutispora sp.]|uniref:hypothetical protein n=1 Tax=Lutispora sp. TaxID=2828727 RepID=UPI003568EAAA
MGKYHIYLRVMNGNGMWSDGGTSSTYNITSMFTRDIEVKYALEIKNAGISGYWNHWRGQIDMFGKQLTNEPHRFLSLEKVRITADIIGGADKVVIRFSPELEAMNFTALWETYIAIMSSWGM